MTSGTLEGMAWGEAQHLTVSERDLFRAPHGKPAEAPQGTMPDMEVEAVAPAAQVAWQPPARRQRGTTRPPSRLRTCCLPCRDVGRAEGGHLRLKSSARLVEFARGGARVRTSPEGRRCGQRVGRRLGTDSARSLLTSPRTRRAGARLPLRRMRRRAPSHSGHLRFFRGHLRRRRRRLHRALSRSSSSYD